MESMKDSARDQNYNGNEDRGDSIQFSFKYIFPLFVSLNINCLKAFPHFNVFLTPHNDYSSYLPTSTDLLINAMW